MKQDWRSATQTEYIVVTPCLKELDAIDVAGTAARKGFGQCAKRFDLDGNPWPALDDILGIFDGETLRYDAHNPPREEDIMDVLIEPNGALKFAPSPTTSCPDENRFIIARALAHRILHWPQIQRAFPGYGMKVPRVAKEGSPVARAKEEAERFAYGFMLPQKRFREVYQMRGHEDTATIFTVPPHIVAKRAEMLGMDYVPRPSWML